MSTPILKADTATASRVFDATAENFEQDVILKSRDVPVLVDFWATWCGPCKSLGPILDKLVEDYGGGFLLAKVDVDQEQELAGYFQIRSVPTVMLVKDAKVVGGFPGALPEGQIRRFLEERGVTPLAGDADRLEAAPAAGTEPADPAAAVEHRRAAVAADPDKPEVKLELALALVAAGEYAEARDIIADLPANLGTDSRATRALSRIRLEESVADAPDAAELEQTAQEKPDDPATLHRLGVRLVLAGEAERGLELLLELLRRHRGYADGTPRQALVDAFNVIDDPDLVRACRRKMTALLF